MNCQLTIQDLAGLLSDSSGKDRVTTELFLREFISLIQESLLNGKNVTLENLGVFGIETLEDSEDCKTVKRLYFLPDKQFLQQVNKPFSFFEKVEITDLSLFDDLERVAEQEAEDYGSSTDIVLEDHNEGSQDESASQDETPEVLTDETTEVLTDETTEVPQEDTETLEELETESLDEPEPLEEPEPVILDKPVQKEEKTEKTHHSSHRSSHHRHSFYKRKKFVRGMIGILLVIVLLALVIFLPGYNRSRRLEDAQKYYEETATDSIKMQVIDSMAVDTVPFADTSAVVAPTKKVVAPAEKKDKKPSESNKVIGVNKANKASKTIKENKEIKEDAHGPTTSNPKVLDVVEIKPGDLLTMISLKYYGHKIYWVYIYLYNKDHITDPNNVPLGTKINIPSPETYGIDSQQPASREKAALIQSKVLNGETIKSSDF